MQDWIEEELATSEIGDARLDARFNIVVGQLSRKPSASVPSACGGWNETTAAYRFFKNPLVDEKVVLEPRFDAALERIREHDVVCIAQDTTEIDMTRPERKMEGAGPLNDEKWLGFYNHVMLAVTPERIPLGVVDARIYARDMDAFPENRENGNKRKQKPIEEKESYRWLEGCRRACEIQGLCPETRIVCLSDSEGDIYECIVEGADEGEAKANWIIRACQNRSVEGERAGKRIYPKILDEVSGAPVVGELLVEVSKNNPNTKDKRKRRQARSKRKTTVEVRAKRVKLRPPFRKGRKLPGVEVNAVLVREKHAPENEPPVEWLLLTDLSIGDFDEMCRVVEYYCCRWQIEIYFRVLKSGCKVEDRQFESADRYLPCLALYMIIAWRVLFVAMLGRQCPEMPCDAVFDEIEWKSVYVVVKGIAPPEKAPSLGEFVGIVAGLGGYLGRKHDGPPGPKTIWLGMQRMIDIATGWSAYANMERPPGNAESCV